MESFTCIVESPKGSSLKYDYDKELKLFRLSKLLPAGLNFPCDFGFINHTLGADGDPLDILILSEFQTFIGCVLDCRIIGAITAEQKEDGAQQFRNDRFIGIPVVSLLYKSIKKISGLPNDFIGQLEFFFINYNQQAGKKFKPIKLIEARDAVDLILKQTVR